MLWYLSASSSPQAAVCCPRNSDRNADLQHRRSAGGAYETLLRSPRRLWLSARHGVLERARVTMSDVAAEPYIMRTVDEASNTAQRYWNRAGLLGLRAHFLRGGGAISRGQRNGRDDPVRRGLSSQVARRVKGGSGDAGKRDSDDGRGHHLGLRCRDAAGGKRFSRFSARSERQPGAGMTGLEPEGSRSMKLGTRTTPVASRAQARHPQRGGLRSSR